MTAVILSGYLVMRAIVDPAVEAIESIESAKAGHIGGLNLPILVSWVVGGIFAAGAAYVIGRISLGLRSDYLAIATLGISEIVIYVLKNEIGWRGALRMLMDCPGLCPMKLTCKQNNGSLILLVVWIQMFRKCLPLS